MRNVEAHLLGDKMDEAVSHFINMHQPSDHVHIDTDGMPMTVQDDGSRITVMHQQTYSAHLCRQVSVSEPVGEGPWGEELLDPEGRIAAIVAHLSQNPRNSHNQPHHKVPSSRNDVDTSVILDSSLRFNGQSMNQQSLAGLPPMQTLPPLQEMKQCQDTDWFTDKSKKNDSLAQLTDSDGPVLELSNGSPAQSRQQSRKSLPHKKRISRKLKRNGGSTPQQDLVVINNIEPVVAPVVEEEQILPDNFVTVQQPTHHIAHEVRPIFICQICGEFYGEEQLKFFQHLKQHYEPHSAIIIDNPVSDLVMDKMSNTCIVDNVATLPDSIVELSLENSVPKTMYQPIDKHSMPLSYNNIKMQRKPNPLLESLLFRPPKVQYSMTSIDKDTAPVEDKTDLYETLDKLEFYNCGKCSKTFRKQKQCEAHMREAHPTDTKLEEMGEFSEPEDLMEGIHVCVSEYEPALLPHLTVDNGHVHQDHTRHWYSRNGSHVPCEGCNDCNTNTYRAGCDRDPEPTHDTHPSHNTHPSQNTHHSHNTHPSQHTHPSQNTHPSHNSHSTHDSNASSHSTHTHTTLATAPTLVCHVTRPSHVTELPHASHREVVTETLTHVTHSQDTPPLKVLKEEVLQRMFNGEVPPLSYSIMHETDHNPHEHDPHSHDPHNHDPHSHDPHNHDPHSHDHHSQDPHNHEPHSHDAHSHDPLNHDPHNHDHHSHDPHSHDHHSHDPHSHDHHSHDPHNHDPHSHNPHNHDLHEHNSHERDDREHDDRNEQKHVVVEETAKDIAPKANEKRKRLECSECGRVFAHRNSLMYHMLSHAARQHACVLCPKAFFTAAALKIHKRVHNGDKPYKCVLCGRDFRQWSDLKYHTMSLHSNMKQFKCDFCGKEFARKYSLNVHRRIHTGERNYKCEYCAKTFSASSYRLTHMRTHTGYRPYKCELCEKSFRSAFDVRRHMLVHEKMRNRLEEVKLKPKDKKTKPEKELIIEIPIEPKKKPPHSPDILKKPQKRKSPANKRGAPNVTVQNRDGQFKMNEFTNSSEFEKPQFTKFKVVYNDSDLQVSYKNQPYKDSDRDGLPVLRPLLREERYRENTDGKLQIYTHVEKGKESELSREVRSDVNMNGEVMGNVFFEEFSEIYNLPP